MAEINNAKTLKQLLITKEKYLSAKKELEDKRQKLLEELQNSNEKIVSSALLECYKQSPFRMKKDGEAYFKTNVSSIAKLVIEAYSCGINGFYAHSISNIGEELENSNFPIETILIQLGFSFDMRSKYRGEDPSKVFIAPKILQTAMKEMYSISKI